MKEFNAAILNEYFTNDQVNLAKSILKDTKDKEEISFSIKYFVNKNKNPMDLFAVLITVIPTYVSPEEAYDFMSLLKEVLKGIVPNHVYDIYMDMYSKKETLLQQNLEHTLKLLIDKGLVPGKDFSASTLSENVTAIDLNETGIDTLLKNLPENQKDFLKMSLMIGKKEKDLIEINNKYNINFIDNIYRNLFIYLSNCETTEKQCLLLTYMLSVGFDYKLNSQDILNVIEIFHSNIKDYILNVQNNSNVLDNDDKEICYIYEDVLKIIGLSTIPLEEQDDFVRSFITNHGYGNILKVLLPRIEGYFQLHPDLGLPTIEDLIYELNKN